MRILTPRERMLVDQFVRVCRLNLPKNLAIAEAQDRDGVRFSRTIGDVTIDVTYAYSTAIEVADTRKFKRVNATVLRLLSDAAFPAPDPG